MKTQTAYGITYNGELLFRSIHASPILAKRWAENWRMATWGLLTGKRGEPLECVKLEISIPG